MEIESKKTNKKKWEPRKLPAGMTLERMEEIFIDRYANLIVRLMDHLHDQKTKAQTTRETDTADTNKKHA